MYRTTGNLKAAVCQGVLDARLLLDYLADRHAGRAPEPGVIRPELTDYCRKRLRIDRMFMLAQLLPLAWLLYALAGIAQGSAPETEVVWPVLLATAIAFAARVERRQEVLSLREKEHEDAARDELRQSLDQTVVVYAGFDAFHAFGVKLDAWSLSIDTTRPVSPDAVPEEFTSGQLLDHMTNALKAAIPGAVIHDCLFARGSMIQGDARFLASRTAPPESSVDAAELQAMVGRKDPDVRHYRMALFLVPGSQAVFSTFFRATDLGGHQFVECHQYLLTDLRQPLRVLDNLAQIGPVRFYMDALSHSTWGILSSMRSGLWLLGFATAKVRKLLFRDKRDRAKLRDPHFNYGHGQSMRVAYAAAEYESVFQSQDKDMLKKSVDARMLNSLVAFLKAHKIDVGDLESTKQQIFNHGVMVSGGSFRAESLAVGKQAKVSRKAARPGAAATDTAKEAA